MTATLNICTETGKAQYDTLTAARTGAHRRNGDRQPGQTLFVPTGRCPNCGGYHVELEAKPAK